MRKTVWIGLGSFLVLLGVIITLQGTMAKYRKNIGTNTTAGVASWNILVNNESILGKDSLSTNIIPTFVENEYVKEGVIAPGSIGHFDIILNASETDVSFQYKIISTISPDSDIKDFIITAYELNPSETSAKLPYIKDEGIVGTMLHNSEPITIRIYIEWNDRKDEEVMDNQQDTEVASNPDAKASLNASITFSQLNA